MNKLTYIIIGMFLISMASSFSVSALTWTKDGTATMNLNDDGNLWVVGNVTSQYFFGDGSQLQNLPSADNSSWNETHANTLYYGKYDNALNFWNDTYATFNKTHADTLYASKTYVDNQISAIGNWSDDKGDYSTTTEANTLYYGKYDNALNFWNDTYATFNKTYADTLYSNDTYVDLINSSMKTYVDDTNGTMKTYVDDTNDTMKTYVDDNYAPTTYVDSLGNYSAENSTIAHTNIAETFDENLTVSGNLSIGTGTTYLDLYFDGSTNFFDTNGYNALFSDNITADFLFGDGSQLANLPAGVETLWNANYSTKTGTGDVVYSTSPTFVTGITVPDNSISDEEIDESDTFAWTGTHSWSAAGTFNDDLIFSDEIKPDNTVCDNNDILFKTGADNWDCKTVVEAGAVGTEVDPVYTADQSDIAFTNISETFDENLLITKNLTVRGDNISLGSSEIDQSIYFYEAGSLSERLYWDTTNDRFEISDAMKINGDLIGTGTINTDGSTDHIFTGGSANLYSSGNIYTSGAGDDFWLGTATQAIAKLQLNATGNVLAKNITADFFFGDGSLLDNLPGNSSWNETHANTLYYSITNPSSFWNDTYATFNKTYADTLYSPVTEPLWAGNSTLVPYLASENVFTANQNITGQNISAIDCIIFDSGGKICSGV